MTKNDPLAQDEHGIQLDILRILRLKGLYCIRVNQGAFVLNNKGRSRMYFKPTDVKGVSDIIAFKNGKAVFLEVKTAKGEQTQNQKDFQSDVERAGMLYAIVRNVEEAVDACDCLLDDRASLFMPSKTGPILTVDGAVGRPGRRKHK